MATPWSLSRSLRSMEFVFVSIFVIFQVDLDLVRHPLVDILTPQAR